MTEKHGNLNHFENTPMVAILTVLSKMQIDVRNAEANVINYLYAQIDAGSFKFNKLGARVIANSNIVFQGEPYMLKYFWQQKILLSNLKFLLMEKQ